MVIMRELRHFFDFSSGCGESLEDCVNVTSLFHGNDSELVLFIDPNQEGLVVVVINSTTAGPVSIETASFEEPISFFKQEVIIDKLVLGRFVHAR